MAKTTSCLILLVALSMTMGICSGFVMPQTQISSQNPARAAGLEHSLTTCAAVPGDGEAAGMTRGRFLTGAANWAGMAALVAGAAPVSAKKVKEELIGTKDDPTFKNCLSQCIYFCTKPKGTETRERSECLPECKKQCATTKEQGLVGKPISAE
eukprot:CAMPEP_0113934946 /NCGR_PEP_ID=MMETSP1339-20121228/2194_1 /TAXON_ID=94617 /ORGANISM="Fibrocapsa japonica" /LENGTH=153 /DNA_ID=CAMNT_0000936929 /DNA_START=87 /DNA_END=548 /DNA_ORIENTATION=+ /assembly_acc=CAM_ASM_000762